MSVVASVSRLLDLMTSRNASITPHLRPGLAPEEIARITASVPLSLPPEIAQLYGHMDLPEGYFYGQDQARFFGIYWLLGLRDAVAFWQERRSYDFIEEREHAWFPVLQDDGNAYLVDTMADAAGHHRIVSVFEGLEPQETFLDLAAMFDTFYHWVSDGVLDMEDGHIAGDYAGDPQRVAAIAARLNPGIDYWASRL